MTRTLTALPLTVGAIVSAFALAGCSSLAGTSSSSATGIDPIDQRPSADASVDPDSGAWLVPLTRGGEFETTQNGLTVTIVCDGGGDVDIDANDVVATIVGSCEEIEVDGSNNVVTAENAEEIDVDGANNEISALDVIEIEVEGTGNLITTTSAVEIEAEGSGNTVRFGSGSPTIEDEGSNDISAG